MIVKAIHGPLDLSTMASMSPEEVWKLHYHGRKFGVSHQKYLDFESVILDAINRKA
jgi:hypothetical protein